MKTHFLSIGYSPLLRNILAVASGTIAGQAIAFSFSLLITRIYSPEAFGLQGVFLSIISILSPVIAARFPLAIVIAKDNEEAQCLSYISLLTALIVAMLLQLILFLFRDHILVLVGADALGNMIYLLPFALFCITLQDVMEYRATRLNSFRSLATATTVHAFTTNLARVLGGLLAPIAMTLMVVTTIAPSIQALLLAWWTRGNFAPPQGLNRREILALISEYRDFPVYRAPTDVINAASQSAPVIVLATLFSPEAAGFYVLARSVLSLPTNIIGSAIGNVLYARFAEMTRENTPLAPLTLKGTLSLLALGPVIVMGSQFSSPIFRFVFGEEWGIAGNYAQWMSLFVSFMIGNIAVVRALPVIGAQYLHLIFNILILIGGVSSLFVGYWIFKTALASVAIYCVAVSLLYAAQIVVYIYFIRRFDRNMLSRHAS